MFLILLYVWYEGESLIASEASDLRLKIGKRCINRTKAEVAARFGGTGKVDSKGVGLGHYTKLGKSEGTLQRVPVTT